MLKTCPNCKKIFEGQSERVYCSRYCRIEYKDTIRRKKHKKSSIILNEKCSLCKQKAVGFVAAKPYCKEHFRIKSIKFKEHFKNA